MKRSLLLAVVLTGCAAQAPQVAPAKGVQIYECRPGKGDGTLTWVFVAPEAELFDRSGRKIGTHYAGPTWEAADGSKVIGAVKERADAGGAIPWLILSTKSVGPDGAFSKVTSIQRLSTTGGMAPSGACTEQGAKARVPYTADYYFTR